MNEAGQKGAQHLHEWRLHRLGRHHRGAAERAPASVQALLVNLQVRHVQHLAAGHVHDVHLGLLARQRVERDVERYVDFRTLAAVESHLGVNIGRQIRREFGAEEDENEDGADQCDCVEDRKGRHQGNAKCEMGFVK